MLSGHQRRAGVDGVLALCRGDDSVDLVSAGRDGSIILWRNGEAVETLKGRLAQSREALKPAPVTRVHSKVTGRTSRARMSMLYLRLVALRTAV